ncbi:MAG: hypothetical protein ACTH5O_10995 [Psychrobacter sp.]
MSSQLISRTTRPSNLAQAGKPYYQWVNNILNAVDALNEQTSTLTYTLSWIFLIDTLT